jgi:hypothetical protein
MIQTLVCTLAHTLPNFTHNLQKEVNFSVDFSLANWNLFVARSG